jgi:integrase
VSDPHPFAVALEGKLRPKSIEAYVRIGKRIEASGLTAAAWLDQEIRRREDEDRAKGRTANLGMPKSTLFVLRSAVAWYASEMEGAGGRASVARELPEARTRPDGVGREALTDAQLALFCEAAQAEIEPYRTLLQLLPLTGLRIHEMCGLLVEDVDLRQRVVTVIGKGGKSRRVPLAAKAFALFDAFVEDQRPTREEFVLHLTEKGLPRPEPRPCAPRDGWRAKVRIRDRHPELSAVVLHQTRHTTATRLMEAGVNLATIRDVLGHASMKSLERYVHPTEETRRRALDTL